MVIGIAYSNGLMHGARKMFGVNYCSFASKNLTWNTL